MPWHGDDRLAAAVEITLSTDAFEAVDEITNFRSDDVTVHAAFLLFGGVDVLALISTPRAGTESPTIRLARWVNAVRKSNVVGATRTSLIISEHHPKKRRTGR